MKESKGAEVLIEPTRISFSQEPGYGNDITGVYSATHIGVNLKGREVWSKNIYPFFPFLRSITLLYIPKPFYPERIGLAKRRADRIARSL